MVTAKDGAGGRGEWEWDRGIAGSAGSREVAASRLRGKKGARPNFRWRQRFGDNWTFRRDL
jgi:hypothetical protein